MTNLYRIKVDGESVFVSTDKNSFHSTDLAIGQAFSLAKVKHTSTGHVLPDSHCPTDTWYIIEYRTLGEVKQ